MSGTDRFISINGLKLHYVEHGQPDAPALMGMPGISSPLSSVTASVCSP